MPHRFRMTPHQWQLLDDASVGKCIDCGHEHEQVEPDARLYACARCGANAVYGMQELVIMDLIDWDLPKEPA